MNRYYRYFNIDNTLINSSIKINEKMSGNSLSPIITYYSELYHIFLSSSTTFINFYLFLSSSATKRRSSAIESIFSFQLHFKVNFSSEMFLLNKHLMEEITIYCPTILLVEVQILLKFHKLMFLKINY